MQSFARGEHCVCEGMIAWCLPVNQASPSKGPAPITPSSGSSKARATSTTCRSPQTTAAAHEKKDEIACTRVSTCRSWFEGVEAGWRHGMCLSGYLSGAEVPLGEDAVADHLQGGGGAAGDARGAVE